MVGGNFLQISTEILPDNISQRSTKWRWLFRVTFLQSRVCYIGLKVFRHTTNSKNRRRIIGPTQPPTFTHQHSNQLNYQLLNRRLEWRKSWMISDYWTGVLIWILEGTQWSQTAQTELFWRHVPRMTTKQEVCFSLKSEECLFLFKLACCLVVNSFLHCPCCVCDHQWVRSLSSLCCLRCLSWVTTIVTIVTMPNQLEQTKTLMAFTRILKIHLTFKLTALHWPLKCKHHSIDDSWDKQDLQ